MKHWICIVVNWKNSNAHLLLSHCSVIRADWWPDRAEADTSVAEEHLQHDLSAFTCCLCHILNDMKAAVWMQCSLLGPRILSGSREGEQLVEAKSVTPEYMSPQDNGLAAPSDLMQTDVLYFWLWIIDDKTCHCFGSAGTFFKPLLTHLFDYKDTGKLCRVIQIKSERLTHVRRSTVWISVENCTRALSISLSLHSDCSRFILTGQSEQLQQAHLSLIEQSVSWTLLMLCLCFTRTGQCLQGVHIHLITSQCKVQFVFGRT